MNSTSNASWGWGSLLLCLLSSACWAADPNSDGLWRGTGGAAASYTSGNSSGAGVGLNLDLARATVLDKITLGANAAYARSKVDGVTSTTSDKWSGFGRYDYNLDPRLFTFAKLGLASDRLVHLSSRVAIDAGLGYKLVETSTGNFSVFGGAGYSTDRYDLPQTISDRIGNRFSRASIALAEESLQRITPTVEFKQRLDVNPGISGDKATLSKFTAGLSVAMTSSLSLTVNMIDSYNSQPPAGAGRNDVGVFTGIGIKFGPH